MTTRYISIATQWVGNDYPLHMAWMMDMGGSSLPHGIVGG